MTKNNTAIEWTWRPGTIGETWNATTGCDKVSAGCGLPRFEGDDTGGCYALAMAKRLKAMGQAKYQNDGDPRTSGPGFGITSHWDALDLPLRWKTPRTVFVNSMSDWGHARISREFVARMLLTMGRTPQHQYLALSKRPDRIARLIGGELDGGQMLLAALPSEELAQEFYDLPWPLPNLEVGTSIELDKYVSRADDLRATNAAVRFLSLEPLLGPLPSLNLTGIDQIIIGGESGPGARPMDLGWVRELIVMARQAGTAVFVKQLGKVWAGSGKGGNWDAWPEDLRIREYPAARTLAAT